MNAAYMYSDSAGNLPDDFTEAIEGMREYDVPYHVRVAIDADIRVGAWYKVSKVDNNLSVVRLPDMIVKAEPRVLACGRVRSGRHRRAVQAAQQGRELAGAPPPSPHPSRSWTQPCACVSV